MKKTISTFMLFSLFALIVPIFSTTANAASLDSMMESEVAYESADFGGARPCTGSKYARFYKRNRNAMNVAIGTGIGTIIGSIVDGKRGALIGAGAGAGGGLLYTYKLNPKTKRCQKVYYRRG